MYSLFSSDNMYRESVQSCLPVAKTQAGSSSTAVPPRKVESSSTSKPARQDGASNPPMSPLQEEIYGIYLFLKELKNNPCLDKGNYSTPNSLIYFQFEEHNDVDRRELGDWFALTDAAELIKRAYETILNSLGLKCLAASSYLSDSDLVVRRMYKLRDILWNNTEASLAFAEKVCNSGMLKHFVNDLTQMKVGLAVKEDGVSTLSATL